MDEPFVKVLLPCTAEWCSEEEVEIINIEKDIKARDVVTFICPECNREHRSLRCV